MMEAINTIEDSTIISMKEKYFQCFNNPALLSLIQEDMDYVFKIIGLNDQAEVTKIIQEIIETFQTGFANGAALSEIENQIYTMLGQIKIEDHLNIIDKFHEGQADRSHIITEQLMKEIRAYAITGKGIDYGCGNGLVSEFLSKTYGVTIEGLDIRDYRYLSAKGAFLFYQFDGYSVPVEKNTYEFAIVTNVLHHEPDNQKILDELYRIVKVGGSLIIIETVPDPDSVPGDYTQEEKAQIAFLRNYFNDAFYNRFITPPSANVPVPGTYELAQDRIKRFEASGFHVLKDYDLGYDIAVIRDRHHMYVLEKRGVTTLPKSSDTASYHASV